MQVSSRKRNQHVLISGVCFHSLFCDRDYFRLRELWVLAHLVGPGA